MNEKGIICVGRPILDFQIRISEQNWQRICQKVDIGNQSVQAIASILIPLADEVHISTGGVESNVAINSALLGRQSLLIGSVGNDELKNLLAEHSKAIPNFTAKLFQQENISSAIVMVVEIIGDKITRKKFIDYGASNELPIDFVNQFKQEFRTCSSVFCSCFSLTNPSLRVSVEAAINMGNDFDKEIIINMGGIDRFDRIDRKNIFNWIRSSADVVSMNKAECTLCSRIIENNPSLMFPLANSVIYTDNIQGAILLHNGNSMKVRAKIVKLEDVISDTGAGDAFLSAFLHAKSNGSSIEEIGNFAASIASTVVKQKESYLTDSCLENIGGGIK